MGKRLPEEHEIAREVLARKLPVRGENRSVTLTAALIEKLNEVAMKTGEPWAVDRVEKIIALARDNRADAVAADTVRAVLNK